MTQVDVLLVLIICLFALFLPVCYGIADVLAQKSNLLWIKFAKKREEFYLFYPWLEPKYRIKKRLKHKEFLFSILEDD